LRQSKTPKIPSRSAYDYRFLCNSPKSHLGQIATVSHITKSREFHLNQFATVGYAATARNLISASLRPQTTSRKPRTSINRFTDYRPLYKSLETSIRRIQICKTTIRQSEICNSILHISVPSTIYFLSHTHSFNHVLFIRFYTFYDGLRQLSQEATGRHPHIQELEKVVQAYRTLLCWRRARLCTVPDRGGILYCYWVYNHRCQHTCNGPRRYRQGKKVTRGPQYWKGENRENEHQEAEVIPKGLCQSPLLSTWRLHDQCLSLFPQ
jgi:hypothetical protein